MELVTYCYMIQIYFICNYIIKIVFLSGERPQIRSADEETSKGTDEAILQG